MTERELFEAALDQAPDERAAFLDRACAGVPAIKERVVALLARQGQAGSFLEGAVAEGTRADDSRPTGASPTTETAGQVLAGRYKLLEQIGEGGMGAVWLALQTEPVRRRVAVKLIKAGMDSRMVLSRFAVERQALALMDHPNIAKVLDGGSTEHGRPFFVMEYVKGIPITQYCDDAHLTVAERLELLVKVCQAVQHAHQKGVIHRDLKPTNLLICLYDDKPVPKVIDFGLAKAMHQPLTDNTLYTAHGLMLGTPLYMSPEQAAVNNLDVDTRSDIYSLGVVLYELLTGTTPLEKEQLRQASLPEILRLIKETEPPKPSTRLSTMGQTATQVSARRHSDPKHLRKLCQGELDWIVMKALEKDRARRYETASAFAADVERYLRNEPVTACPPSAWYRIRKLVRRKRGALTMALVVAAALVIGTAAIGGSIGWALNDRAAQVAAVVRDREVREAALDEQVDRDLDEAAAVIRTVQWPTAAASLARAEKLLISAGRTQFPPRLRELQKDLLMAQRLEEIDDLPRFADYLVDGTQEQADSGYRKAFEEYGIDLAKLSVAEAVERIRARAIRLQLARALDSWFYTRYFLFASPSAPWEQLLAVATAVDPDPWRCQLRETLRGRNLKGLQALAASADLPKVPPGALVLLGAGLRKQGAGNDAVVFLRKAQRQYPGDLSINDLLGSYCYGTVQYDEAVACYTAALALRPGRWQTWYARALAYHALAHEASFANPAAPARRTARQLEELCMADLSTAIAFNPNRPAPWQIRSNIHFAERRWELAIADYSTLITRDLTTVGAGVDVIYRRRGDAYRAIGKWTEAGDDYSQAIALKPKAVGNEATVYAWAGRGQIHAILGEWKKAAADTAEAIERKPHHSLDVLWMQLAAYRLRAGDTDGYHAACRTMLELFGQTKDPLVAQRVVLSCLLLPAPGGPPAAPVQLAALSAARAPNDRWCAVTHGAALHRTGQCAQAVLQLELWGKNSWGPPGDGGRILSQLLLAMAHHQLGHTEDASRWLRQAVVPMDKEISAKTIGPLRQEAHVWAMCQILRGEAESLLKKAD